MDEVKKNRWEHDTHIKFFLVKILWKGACYISKTAAAAIKKMEILNQSAESPSAPV